MYKICKSCEETKHVELFSKCTSNVDGLQRKCKECNKKYRQLNKDHISETKKNCYIKNIDRYKSKINQYYIDNKETIIAYQKEYSEINRDNIVAYKKEYNKNNKERFAPLKQECAKNYRKNNKNKIAKQARDYRRNNKDRINSNTAKRNAAKLQALPKWLTKEELEQIKELYTCAQMFKLYTGQEYHVDHIVPLQGENVCGLHVPWNLQVIPASENLSKSNKLQEELL